MKQQVYYSDSAGRHTALPHSAIAQVGGSMRGQVYYVISTQPTFPQLGWGRQNLHATSGIGQGECPADHMFQDDALQVRCPGILSIPEMLTENPIFAADINFQLRGDCY